ncbi:MULTISPECIES: ATP-binding cassette domain-containing protein [Sphingomonas]|uniref:ATP-binding cassette domain-containing protein n=1 Tax=Sphingomonas TaxID=13687 RepID=UPI0008327459|nr:ABC transporter ATP-binding protein [Sphingomonas sp. CCH10-B3]
MAGRAGSALRFARDAVGFAGRDGAVAALISVMTSVAEGAALALVAPLLALLAGEVVASPTLARLFATLGATTPFAQLVLLLALIGGLWVARGLLAWHRDTRLALLTMAFAEQQRRLVVTRLAQALWGQVASMQHARIVQALGGDVTRIAQATHMLIQIVVASVMLVAFAIVALLLAPLLATIALGLIALVGAALALLLRRTQDIGALAVRANLELTEASTRFLGGLRVAASQNLQPSFVQRFEAGLSALRAQQVQYTYQQNSARLMISGAALAVGAIIALVGRGWLATPLPQLGALMLVLSRLGGPVSQIQQSLQQLLFALPAYAQLVEVAEELVPVSPATGPLPEIPERATVVLDAVYFAHPARSGVSAQPPVLAGASLTLDPGEMVGLTGASGAGKSTLADVLVGLLTPQAGVVRVGKRTIAGDAAAAWRERIAYAAQDPYLFHASVRENLLWGARTADEASLWAALEKAAAADLVRALPQGLETIVGERGALLSGGERQRLALARALLRSGQLLILDEATSAVDIATEARIFTALRVQAIRPAMLVIAHRAETLAYCDRVVALKAGTIVQA